VEGIEEGLRQLVITSGDGAIGLQMSDHALDAVTFAIDAFVPTDFDFPIGFGRNARTDARVVQAGSDSVAVVTLVRDQIGGLFFGERYDIFECRDVVRFAGREMEGEREPFGITETMNFTGEPAPRAAKSLFASPPFAPAAETCPRTVVESML